MITHIKGTLVEKTPTYAVIDCDGVGYMIHISLTTFSRLPEQSASCLLYTHFAVKEDAQTLFGFFTPYERDVFRLLITVSGIGTGTARMMLSSFPPEEVAAHIAAGDVAAVRSIKGIGEKTAQRVVVELKDKIQKLGVVVANNQFTAGNKAAEEALSALVQLGFTKPIASKAVQQVLKKEGGEHSVEDMIRLALKML